MNIVSISDCVRCEEGDWRVQDGYELPHGFEVEQLRKMDCNDLHLTETGYSDKLVSKLRKVLEAGKETPAIDAHEAPDGKWYITDGKHRWWAHRLEHKPIWVWCSPQGKDGEGMTYQELTGRAWEGGTTGLCTYAFYRRHYKITRAGERR